MRCYVVERKSKRTFLRSCLWRGVWFKLFLELLFWDAKGQILKPGELMKFQVPSDTAT